MFSNYRFIWLAFLLFSCFKSTGQESGNELSDGVRHCLKCHGQQTYSLHNVVTEMDQKKLMNPYFIIDTTLYLSGVHRTFGCTDCHSGEYVDYPHRGELKLEPLLNCLDCHGGDETFAKYHFERLDEEFRKSVHYEKNGDNFTCSKCHNPHNYHPLARNSSSIEEIVAYNNEMCLNCHNDVRRFHTLSDSTKLQLGQIHAWLPNQELHWKNVRCIECHTQVTDSLMVSHHILPKEEARQVCSECHSANSVLKASLYKYENLRSRTGNDAVNALLRNEAYIIGANQVPALKILSLIILAFVVAGIAIHLTFRIRKKE